MNGGETTPSSRSGSTETSGEAPGAPAAPATRPSRRPRNGRHDRRWWIALIVVLVGSFAVLLGLGKQIDTEKPPIPVRVVAGGEQLMTGEDIITGQQIWQSLGGQEIGSVWGHGAYVAPDWTADWLHREAVWHLDTWARQGGAASYAALGAEQQAVLQARLKTLLRSNTYDPATPIHGARAFAGLFTGSRLLTYRGWGHGGLFNSCVTRAFDRYYGTGALPPAGATCAMDGPLFDSSS